MKHAITTLALLTLCGCTNLKVQDTYVQADRATYDALSPVIRKLADTDPLNDPDLTGVNGRGALMLLDSWESRLLKAEGE